MCISLVFSIALGVTTCIEQNVMGLGKLEEGVVQSRNVLHATKVNGGSCKTACQTLNQ